MVTGTGHWYLWQRNGFTTCLTAKAVETERASTLTVSTSHFSRHHAVPAATPARLQVPAAAGASRARTRRALSSSRGRPYIRPRPQSHLQRRCTECAGKGEVGHHTCTWADGLRLCKLGRAKAPCRAKNQGSWRAFLPSSPSSDIVKFQRFNNIRITERK